MNISKVQCLQAAVSADSKIQKALAAEQGPSSTADHPFEGKAYVQVCNIYSTLLYRTVRNCTVPYRTVGYLASGAILRYTRGFTPDV